MSYLKRVCLVFLFPGIVFAQTADEIANAAAERLAIYSRPEYSSDTCWLGAQVLSDGKELLFVVAIFQYSEDQKLRVGDRLDRINGNAVTAKNIRSILGAISSDAVIDVEVTRGEEFLTVSEKCADSSQFMAITRDLLVAKSKRKWGRCARLASKIRKEYPTDTGAYWDWFYCSSVAGKLKGDERLDAYYQGVRLDLNEVAVLGKGALLDVQAEIEAAVEYLKAQGGTNQARALQAEYKDALANAPDGGVFTRAETSAPPISPDILIQELVGCAGAFTHARRTIFANEDQTAGAYRSWAIVATNLATETAYQEDQKRFEYQRQVQALAALSGDPRLTESFKIAVMPPRPFAEVQAFTASEVERIASQWDAIWLSGNTTAINPVLEDCNAKAPSWGR